MIPLFFSSIFSTVLRDFIFADFSKVHVVERERKMCRFVFIFEQKVIERERKTVLEIGIICGRTRSRFSCGVNDATSRWISRFYFFHSRKISIIDISLRLEIIKRYFTRNTNFLNNFLSQFHYLNGKFNVEFRMGYTSQVSKRRSLTRILLFCILIRGSIRFSSFNSNRFYET